MAFEIMELYQRKESTGKGYGGEDRTFLGLDVDGVHYIMPKDNFHVEALKRYLREIKEGTLSTSRYSGPEIFRFMRQVNEGQDAQVVYVNDQNVVQRVLLAFLDEAEVSRGSIDAFVK